MKATRLLWFLAAASLFVSCSTDQSRSTAESKSDATERAQVPTWSRNDLEFFIHGSMSTEFIPERVFRAFMRTYPDLFPKEDLSNLGLIPDPAFGWPVGFSRQKVPHLGDLSSVGINCAACHVGEITLAADAGPKVRVLGMTSHFDVEGFFGAVVISTFRTADPANMKKFLAAYLSASHPKTGDKDEQLFSQQWQRQEPQIKSAMAGAAAGGAPGLRPVAGKDLSLDPDSLAGGQDLAALSVAMLNLFHNMRFALHVPDMPPPASPPNGPGRNDPWRILAYSLLGVVTEPAPVKFGLVWNEDRRTWVHYDGNTRSAIVRNLAASLGLGAPLIEHRGLLNFAAVQRQTTLSEVIRPPPYPWTIDRSAAQRGAALYQAQCASCHDGPQTDARLYPLAEIKTDPNRATIFTQPVADGFNRFFAELQIAGYEPPQPAPLRATQKYWAPSLAGVWARAPYLHNGSVRTLQQLLTPPADRAKTFHCGTSVYDPAQMGYADEGSYVLDTGAPGNSCGGHEYGTRLSGPEKRDLIEYLKTL